MTGCLDLAPGRSLYINSKFIFIITVINKRMLSQMEYNVTYKVN